MASLPVLSALIANFLPKQPKSALNLHVLSCVTFLDVADAERVVFATELALQQTQGQVAVDSISLYKAVGGSWISGQATPRVTGMAK